MSKAKNYNGNPAVLASTIDPHRWYDINELRKSGFFADSIGKLCSDPHQIKLLESDREERYLGAFILNCAIRSGQVSIDSLPPDLRYLNPIRFANDLEIPPPRVLSYKSNGEAGAKKSKLVELVEVKGVEDYRIDVSTLHFFRFENIDRTNIGLKGSEKEEIIERFRVSGSKGHYLQAFKAYDPLVKYLAGRIASGVPKSVELGDLISAGREALLKAIEDFSMSMGVKFESYASIRIRGAIMDELRGMDWVSRSIRSKAREVEEYIKEFSHTHFREPSAFEIGTQFDVSQKDVAEILDALTHQSNLLSLDELTYGSDDDKPVPLVDTLEQRTFMPYEDTDLRDKISEAINRSVALLTEQEQVAVVLYHFEGLTEKEIGARMGLSESRICQVLEKAANTLRSIADLRLLYEQTL